MAKSIIISIKPKYVANILNGIKTLEIRKSYPKCELPIDVYIYCTKDNKQRLYPVALLDKSNQVFKRAYREDKIDNRVNYLNGKVVAKFTLNKVDRYVNGCDMSKKCKTFNDFEKILTPACIYTDELINYCEDLSFFAWHIENLEIFKEPKELGEFYPYCKDEKCEYRNHHCSICYRTPLTKAPQSYMYIEVD